MARSARARSCSSAAISTRALSARASWPARREPDGHGPCVMVTAAETASLTEHVTSLELGAHVSGAGFLGEVAWFALGDGRVVLRRGEEAREIAAHGGAVQVCLQDRKALYTGGDDGRLKRIDAAGST